MWGVDGVGVGVGGGEGVFGELVVGEGEREMGK